MIEFRDDLETLRYVLSLCDPRYDSGEGMVCQFCEATEGETHKPNCIYGKLTNW